MFWWHSPRFRHPYKIKVPQSFPLNPTLRLWKVLICHLFYFPSLWSALKSKCLSLFWQKRKSFRITHSATLRNCLRSKVNLISLSNSVIFSALHVSDVLIQTNGSLSEHHEELVVWFMCVGSGKRLKHAGQRSLQDQGGGRRTGSSVARLASLSSLCRKVLPGLALLHSHFLCLSLPVCNLFNNEVWAHCFLNPLLSVLSHCCCQVCSSNNAHLLWVLPHCS